MATEQLPRSSKSPSTNGAPAARASDGDPDSELARTEEEIARTRVRVAGHLVALRHEVARRADWREWVRRRPLPFLAAAFALGIYLGSRHGRRPAGNA